MAGRRVTMGVVASTAVMVLAAAACAPYFSNGAMGVSMRGPLVRISWSAAIDDDPGESVAEYGIEVDGTEVARVPASWGQMCVLTGLSPGTTYGVSVTAYGSNGGEWSGSYTGDLASLARVSVSVTPGGSAVPVGSAKGCVPIADADADGLPDALEDGTGTFVSAARTGTSPTDPDTDADGINDGDEVLGTLAGLPLFDLGTRPTKKDLLIEYDWMESSIGCGAHSLRPKQAAMDRLRLAFAALTTTNPDGTTGVNVIGDWGQGGLFTGGNLVPDADGTLDSGVDGSEFGAVKDANFAANREGIFHYALMVHAYNVSSTSSGQAELPGDDVIVSLGCYAGNDDWVANTVMHEVGHNLGLRHGGDTHLNRKPNYNSVMNYRYQFPGVDTTCDANGDGVLAYSTGTRVVIDEYAVVEAQGVCGSPAIDWNANGSIDPAPYVRDLNSDGTGSVFTDHDDNSHLCLSCVTSDGADGASPFSEPEIITEEPPPPLAD